MKVRLGTIEIDNLERRLLRLYHGLAGLATREEVRAFYINHAEADLIAALDHAARLEEERKERERQEMEVK